MQELYLHWERDRNSHMGHQAMWLTAMHSGSDVTVCPNCVAVHEGTYNRKMRKRLTCACVYGFNVWSHDKAQTGNCVCVLRSFSPSPWQPVFILFASGCMSRRELCHFHPRKCPCQRLLKFGTTCTLDSHPSLIQGVAKTLRNPRSQTRTNIQHLHVKAPKRGNSCHTLLR